MGVCGVQTACSLAYKYSNCKQRKRATSRLSYNTGFLKQLVGKQVGCGKYGLNPRKAGHFGYLQDNTRAITIELAIVVLIRAQYKDAIAAIP